MVERAGRQHRRSDVTTWAHRTATAVAALAVGAIGAVAAVGTTPLPVRAASPVPTTVVADDDWLALVNAYRAMSGLAPVREDSRWSAQARDHSCYMLRNGMSHDETPGLPGYTDGGDIAGNSGNVAVNSYVKATARNHIDLWMTGPFHAIGVLRPALRTTGFGMCADAATSPWRSGATLDVVRGVDANAPRQTTPVVFPGHGATVPLSSFITETPDPMALCGWTGSAGLPLIAIMPRGVSSATATLTGPSGPIETCVLHAGNTAADAHANAVLAYDNAVVVVPRVPLSTGTYIASVSSNGGPVTWSFGVDPKAPIVAARPIDVPDTTATSTGATFDPVAPFRHADSRAGIRLTRLRGGQPQIVRLADATTTAVSANFTVDRPQADGYLTVYNCTADVPEVSTLNFSGAAVPNQAVVPLSDGALCLYSPVDTDVVIDVNGWFRAGPGASGYHPLTPTRLVDTRGAERLRAGEIRSVAVEGVAGGAPVDATAVAVNLTVVGPAGDGFLRAFPCDQTGGDVSNVNFRAGRDRPNSAIVRTAPDGTVCVVSTVDADLLVDITGYVAPGAGLSFTTLDPVRLLDTRSDAPQLNRATASTRLAPGQVVRLPVAGVRGVPPSARVASVNLTAVDPATAGFVTAVPCGATPTVSNLNTSPDEPAVANGAMVELDADGALCLSADHEVHLLVDINGVWS